jgi:23S rRNA (uridine2552-2'-O)-methyltransferase
MSTKKPTNQKKGFRKVFTKVKTAKGRRSSSTKWLQRQLNDPYVLLAQKHNYRARSAFKLIEIDDKFKLLAHSKLIIDLGAAPGSWLQIAQKRARKTSIIAIDLQEIEPLDGVELIHGDFTDEAIRTQLSEKFSGKKADLVMSDMAPAACGHPQTDHLRIIDLAEQALDFAILHLKPEGNFICKLLRGGGDNEFLTRVKKNFKSFKVFKPESSRKDSSEVFLVALNFKADNTEN